MIQGTTPTHVFKLSIDTASIDKVRITYVQLGRVVMEKTEQDVSMEGTAITLSLSQEETLALSFRDCVRVQVKVLTTTGQVLASRIYRLSVDKILNTEVLL